jgi:non-homologous end joining protein Ku
VLVMTTILWPDEVRTPDFFLHDKTPVQAQVGAPRVLEARWGRRPQRGGG